MLLVIDETHTIWAGPGGCTAAWGLDPDIVVIGKPIGGGVPVAAYGVTDEIADRLVDPHERPRLRRRRRRRHADRQRMALAAVRATLATTLLDADYARMIPLADRWTDGVAGGDRRARPRLDGAAARVPSRVLVLSAAANGADAAAAVDDELDAFMHLWALNRGVLMTPFHNMALMSPAHDRRRRRPPHRGLLSASKPSPPDRLTVPSPAALAPNICGSHNDRGNVK